MDPSTKIAYSALAASVVVAFALLATRAEAQATKSPEVETAQPAPQAPAPAARAASASGAEPNESASNETPAVESLPPPPPGYAYVPVATATTAAPPPASSAELTSELGQVDARMRELKQVRAKQSLTGPIVMMATGFGVALVSGTAALASFAAAEDVEGRRLEGDFERDDERDEFLDVNDDGSVDADDEDQFRRLARFTTALSVVSAGVGIAGTAWFADRMRDRNEYNPELRGLKQRHRQLRRQLNYGAAVAPEGMRLSLRGRF
jgi:hypothetical protein